MEIQNLPEDFPISLEKIDEMCINFKEIGDSNSDAPVLEFRNKFKEYKNKS